jgi:hypothetical protein
MEEDLGSKPISEMTMGEWAQYLESIGRGPGTPAHDAALAHSARMREFCEELRRPRKRRWWQWL